jgi:hypothetical protein
VSDYPDGPLASRRAPNPDPFDSATIAADYAIVAVGVDNAHLLVAALTAGWLVEEERKALWPLAVAVAYLAGLPYPEAGA